MGWHSGILNREPISGKSGLWLILMGFVMGGIMMWIYVAIQPRFGNGHLAAISAGLITWLLVYVLAFEWSVAMEVYTTELYIWTLVWSFFETLLTSLSGSWLYKK